MHILKSKQAFPLECGDTLSEIEIAYTTSGTINAKHDNIIWIFHALTANADPEEWWPEMVGNGKMFDPEKYFIVCANMLGSCYGTTGAADVNPDTGKAYALDFPNVTVRDMVQAHQILRKHLGIKKIRLGIGSSMGGQQGLEWAIAEPDLFEHLCVIATNAQHSPWGIAFNEAQRMAIFSDASIYENQANAGAKGLEAARAIGMLSYRNYRLYQRTQYEMTDKLDDFRASSYQQYQGEKLRKRFNAWSYISLSKAMDSHNIGRGRKSIADALSTITAKTLVVSIESDLLFPPEEQVLLAENIPNAKYVMFDSPYGHDGFLLESETLTRKLKHFLRKRPVKPSEKNKFSI